jgi:hypothetical protein
MDVSKFRAFARTVALGSGKSSISTKSVDSKRFCHVNRLQ